LGRPAAPLPDQHPDAPHEPAGSGAVGVLGGSFDPFHIGHLQLARDARDRLALAEVRLMPAGQPWQKGRLTEAAARAEMVARAIVGEPRLVLDRREIARAGPSYTIDTLRELRAECGPQPPLVLIIGSDQFARLDTWRDWQRLLDFAHIAIAQRAEEEAAPATAAGEATLPATASAPAATVLAWRHAHRGEVADIARLPAGRVIDLPMTPVAASATEIRALLTQPAGGNRATDTARERRLAALLPAPVLLYIRQSGLYRPLP
jgi:nicotinate-nucleotide adenylyltransferase